MFQCVDDDAPAFSLLWRHCWSCGRGMKKRCVRKQKSERKNKGPCPKGAATPRGQSFCVGAWNLLFFIEILLVEHFEKNPSFSSHSRCCIRSNGKLHFQPSLHLSTCCRFVFWQQQQHAILDFSHSFKFIFYPSYLFSRYLSYSF